MAARGVLPWSASGAIQLPSSCRTHVVLGECCYVVIWRDDMMDRFHKEMAKGENAVGLRDWPTALKVLSSFALSFPCSTLLLSL